MRILITGGAGFIGSHLSGLLLEQENEVTVIDDLSTGSFKHIERYRDNKKYHFVIDTVLNEQVMDRLVSENEIVIHLAAAVGVKLIVDDPVHVIEANVRGTETVLKTANRYRRKILIASTSEVYGKNSNLPFHEDHDLVMGPTSKHRWIYACSKAIDEFSALAYHRKYHLPVVVVRFFFFFCPRQTGRYGMVVPRFIEQALAGEPITVYGSGEQSRCFTDVRDVINGLLGLLNCREAEGKVFNIGSTREISINALAQLVKDITGSSSIIQHISYDQAYDDGFEDMMKRIPDISRIRNLVGFQPKVSLEQTIKDIIATRE